MNHASRPAAPPVASAATGNGAGRPSRPACRRSNSCIASDNIRSILEA